MTTLEKAYQSALDYIYRFVDYSRTHHDQLSVDDFDLSRMEEFIHKLDRPDGDYQSLHVAGSKGKGSVSAFCASCLQAQGYRVGLFTSPHLKDFEERIQVNGKSISRRELVELLEEIKPLIESFRYPTTFEIITALGLTYFSRREVDLAVIEVGLGGRLDSTNVITPNLSVITALYLDHTPILGDTIPEIAREKGGIIKPGVPVVVAPQQDPSANRMLKKIAQEQQAPISFVGEDYQYRVVETSLQGQKFHLEEPGQEGAAERAAVLDIPLLGEFQVENAVTAYAALRNLDQQGIEVSSTAIKKGFQQVNWPGRFEVLNRAPALIVDSAHNPASCQLLMETIREFFPEEQVTLIFGISADKQLPGMLDALLPEVVGVIATQADHPRAMDAVDLAEFINSRGGRAEAIPVVREALAKALATAQPEEVILVAGSIFVAASARIAWLERRR